MTEVTTSQTTKHKGERSPSPGVWAFPAWAAGASQAGAVNWGQDDEFRGWCSRDPTALGLTSPGLDGTS